MDFDFKAPDLSILPLRKDNKQMIDYMIKHEMAPLYFYLVKSNKIMEDEETHQKFRKIAKVNAEKIQKLEEQKKQNEENESYIFEIDKKIAEYYGSICDYENFVKLTTKLIDINQFISLRIDIFLCRIRMAIILCDSKETEKSIQLCGTTCESGCDWDRRNKYKLYNGLYFLAKSKYSESAELLCDALSTFQSTELFSYEKAVLYAIFTGLISFDRETIEKKIMNNSNVLEAKQHIEKAYALVFSISRCEYGRVLIDLASFIDSVADDVFLSRHLNHFCREMKIRIYSQLLKSYESLSLEFMSSVFGVSVEYIENDMSDFIVKDRLPCKIDSVNMTVAICEKESSENVQFVEVGDEIVKMIKKNLK